MVVSSHLGVLSLKKNFVVFPALVLGMAAMAHAQTPAKVAIIHVQNAILQTKDGQKAASDLQGRFAPKKADLDKKQADIAALQDTLDRKSTRLNSSHLVISYAVFCLKKKKKKRGIYRIRTQ